MSSDGILDSGMGTMMGSRGSRECGNGIDKWDREDGMGWDGIDK